MFMLTLVEAGAGRVCAITVQQLVILNWDQCLQRSIALMRLSIGYITSNQRNMSYQNIS